MGTRVRESRRTAGACEAYEVEGSAVCKGVEEEVRFIEAHPMSLIAVVLGVALIVAVLV